MLASLIWAAPLRALDPRKPIPLFSHNIWNTANGLPQDSVRAMAQTTNGYLWLGTQAGLARFDGVSFTVFDHVNSPLKHDHVLALCASRDGSLWIGTGDSGGLYRWTAQSGIRAVRTGSNIRALFEDRAGVLWVGAQLWGLLQVTKAHPDGIRVGSEAGIMDVRAITQDRSGALWIGSDDTGLFRQDGRGFVHYGRERGVPETAIWALWPAADGSIWAGTKSIGLIHLAEDKARCYTVRDGLPVDSILALQQDRDGNLWIGTDGGGLSRYRAGYFETHNERTGLPGSIVRSILEDSEGNLWLGTAGSGLTRLKDDPFVTYGSRDGLSNDLVWSMGEGSDGSVWVGTADSWLNRWKNGRITRFRESGPTARVLPVFEDPQGILWAGFRPAQSQRSEVSHPFPLRPVLSMRGGRLPPACSFAQPIRAIAAAPDGAMWLGSNAGMVQLIAGACHLRFTETDGLPSNQVRAIAFDRQGGMWVATTKGLAKMAGNRFQTVNREPELCDDSILALYIDSRGDAWVGSRTTGLYRVRSGKLTHYTRVDGMADDQVFSILEDGRQNLWITSRRGIYRVSLADIERFDRREERRIGAVIYENFDGLRSSEINYDAKPPAMRTRDGRFWFATYGGVAVVDPEHLEASRESPPVYVERVKAGGADFAVAGAVRLGPEERNIEIQYTALNYRAPQRVRFRYRMEGFDRDWVDADTRRVAYYTNLAPRTYRFRVIASNSDGVWNTAGASLDFVIRPYFYETAWFWVLLVATAGIATFQVFRARSRIYGRREAELNRRVDERTRELQAEIQVRRNAEQAAEAASRSKSEFLANMSHEIRTPINGITGMTNLALALAQQPEQQEYLNIVQGCADSLMGLLNDILDLSRIEAGRLTVEPIPSDVRAIVSETVQLLEVTARSKGLETHFDCASDVPPAVVVDPLRLRQVLVNLLGNAIKFTETGHITVRLSLADPPDRLRLTVRDTGIGIPLDRQAQVFQAFTQADGSITRKYGGTGLGLTISARLIELMGGTIRLESVPGEGTTFEVLVPYGHHEGPLEPARQSAPDSASSTPLRILLAEDNAVNQKVASRLLERFGHTIVVVPDGLAAVSAASRETFDLILMDVQMPELDGLQATAAIRAQEAGRRHTPIIAMTACAMKEDRERCLEAGMDGYTAKPLKLPALFQEIARVASQIPQLEL